MGHQIIKQPDGKYAVFSTGTDQWIIANQTPATLEDYYAERAAEDTRASVRRLLAELEVSPAKAYFQFALTFEDANATSVKNGGMDLSRG